MTGALWVGNLDWEITLRPDRKRVSTDHLRSLSALATLMRAFAAADDAVWTPHPVDPARVPDVAGLEPVRWLHGPLGDARFDTVEAWAEAEWVDSLRRSPSGRDPSIVVDVHDRRHMQSVLEGLRAQLPGSRIVDDMTALADHLANGGADAGGGEWIVKAPLTAAGRDRVRGHDGRLPDDGRRTKIERLFETFGPLVFEPWMPRIRDFGCAGLVAEDYVAVEPTHEQRVDGYGRFRALTLGASGSPADAVRSNAKLIGETLRSVGFRGPFGLDAWTWRDGDTEELHPFGEINARRTMGHVAHALARRLGSTGGTLFVGAQPVPADAIPLLAAAPGDPAAAWWSASPGA